MWMSTSFRRTMLSTLMSSALLFGAQTSFAQSSHQTVVAQKKAILLSRGEDVSGPCGAFKITREVAADPSVKSEGWGLVHSTGSGCAISGDVYRSDTLMQPNGFTVDILTRSESDNGNTSNNNAFNIPSWDQTGNQDPANWRAPLSSNVAPVPMPVPGPTPTPAPVPMPILDLTGVYERIKAAEAATERQYSDLSRRIDAVSGQVTGVSVQVKEHDEKVSGLVAFFTNGKTITGIVTALAGIALQRYVLAPPAATPAP